MKRPSNDYVDVDLSDVPKFNTPENQTSDRKKSKAPKEYQDADVPEGTPDRMYDEEGEVNLSKSTLKDAVKYMNCIGIPMPVPVPGRNVNTGRIVEKLPVLE